MIDYKAGIENDHLQVIFHRLYRDGRDIMCDSLKPQWEPEDKFIITLKKRVATRTTEIQKHPVLGIVRIESENIEILDEMVIRTDSKQAANYIWYLAKHGARFDDIKAMHKAKKF
jgi:hypothetical protein